MKKHKLLMLLVLITLICTPKVYAYINSGTGSVILKCL